MKKIFFLFCLILSLSAAAETKTVQMLEGGIKGGFTTPLGAYHHSKGEISMMLGIEGRYNFEDTPISAGLILELTSACHKFDMGKYYKTQNNRTLIFAAVGEYNFRQGHKVNPYGAVALGFGSNDIVGDKVYDADDSCLLFSPRIGVEFLYHIRLETGINICRIGFNNYYISLGFVIGGRPKKR